MTERSLMTGSQLNTYKFIVPLIVKVNKGGGVKVTQLDGDITKDIIILLLI